MKLPFDKKYFGLGLTLFLVIAASILFYLLLLCFPSVWGFLRKVCDILSPIAWGLGIAYILNPILRFFENRCFTPLFAKAERPKRPAKLIRALSLLCTLLVAVGILTALVWLVIPQLIKSINKVVQSIPTYFNNIEQFAENLLKSYPDLSRQVSRLLSETNTSFEQTVQHLLSFTTDMIPKLGAVAGSMAQGAIGVVSGVINLFVGIVVSIYVLFSKELFANQIKRITTALFPARLNRRFYQAVRMTDRTFGGFISGKLLDSAIIGVLCFIFCSIVRMPYAPLVSVLIGVTNIIPFFGPFFGAVPSAFIILLESPLMALVFVLFIVVLQQIDGNIIGPKILGDSTGLSAFWVIFAILLGGGLFGVVGMFIGVPTFAVLYTFVSAAIKRRLQNKGLPVEPDAYSAPAEPPEDSGKS